SKEDKDRIVHAISSNKEPPKTTALGGGIGIHGWNGVWTANGSQNLTWGCISLNNNDLDIFYEEIPLNTKIIIHE
ncbi:MAG: L,D-transpeptidase, partial [Flavobacteriales bacterium]|nr:L,D-transpeptidase [Flavobacteriales bacterium]